MAAVKVHYKRVDTLDDEEKMQVDVMNKMRHQLRSSSCQLKFYTTLLLLLGIAQLIYIALFHTDVPCKLGMSLCRRRSKHATLPEKRNVIFMVSDGFGPTSETYARYFYQYLKDGRNDPSTTPRGDLDAMLPLDTILVGTSRTRSYDSLITDSAAGATAFSCLLKTYNNAVGVNATQHPCPTLMEVAKMAGYSTGLVVRSRITDATPASFSSHLVHRKYQPEIAYQQVGFGPFGRSVDVIMGGGRCFYKPGNDDSGRSCREDDVDLEHLASKHLGYSTVINSRSEFDQLTGSADELPLLALFTDQDMSYEIDRNPAEEPSLAEMTAVALKQLADLSKNSDKGFFILVEGSRIDHAAHSNDAAAHAHEILAYQETIQVVKDFIDQNEGTVMISTSDHETGGVTLGRQIGPKYPDYVWYPQVVAAVKNSTEVIAQQLLGVKNKEDKKSFVLRVLPEVFGIDDFSEETVQQLVDSDDIYQIQDIFGSLVNERAMIAFTTHGHTGVDVNVYAYAGQKYSRALHPVRGNQENTNIGLYMKNLLQLDDTLFEKAQVSLLNAVADGSLTLDPRLDKNITMVEGLQIASAAEFVDRFHTSH
ncbi:hypothetical protein MIR68_004298 [Amoeboaphelidium protococcarum]|nr:hypothetical protein MIR68_004298 [Amoeboaphelidium protococcarum]